MLDAASPETHALMQDAAFAAALRLCGQTPLFLPSGHLVLHRRVAGMPVAMLPRAVPPPDLAAQLRAVGLARTPLVLSPERPCGTLGLRLRKPASTASIDLSPPAEQRRATLHGKWRNQLKRAEKSALRVRFGPLRPDDDLPEQDAVRARKTGYRNWPAGLTRAFATLSPDQTIVATATLKGHPVAQMLFLVHGTRATYHMGHIGVEGRAHHAHNLILWQAQQHLARRAIVQLDLGLLHADTPTLNRFKTRAGGVPMPTGGSFLRWTPFAPRD